MADIKPVKEASQDFASDLMVLRDDIRNLTAAISGLVHTQGAAAKGKAVEAVDDVQKKITDGAAEVQNRLRGAGSDIGAMIERNPLVAVLTALSAGLLIGMMSGGRK